MAVGSPPTVRRRQLGRELRRLREEANLLAEELAAQLRCSPSRISRIETARIRIGPGTVHEILDALKVEGPERSRLVTLARQAEERGWWQAYTDALPYGYATYIALESEATGLKIFEPIVVHGLLQTEEYARAVAEQYAGPREPAAVDAHVRARLARQEILNRPDPPPLHVVLDESVLHRVIGSRAILRGQLRHLAEVARMRKVTLQVVPFDSADPVAYVTGPMVIIEFPESRSDPVTYIENVAGGLYIERPEEVHTYLAAFDRLCAAALSPEQTVTRIEAQARRTR
ncbi:MAG: helix-turn-helix domain-containing protein [Micromonosporaceae bacterium]|nr:helix-turn-helix domain-containing protein [Micromonosporaceae bacterium]